MKAISNEEFVQLFDRGGGRFSDLSITGTRFDNCGISLTRNVQRRSTIDNVSLRDCELMNCAIGPAVITNSTISDIRTGDLQIVWGALFGSTSLSGTCGRMKIIPQIHDPDCSAADQSAFDAERMAFYANPQNRLDISQVRPTLLEIHGVPGANLTIDRECQCVVSKERWREAKLSTQDLAVCPPDLLFMLEDFIGDSDAVELVVVSPTGKSKRAYSPYVETVKELTSIGVVL